MDPIALVITLVVGVLIGAALGALMMYLYDASRLAQLQAQQTADSDKLSWLRRAQEDMQKVFSALAFKTLRKQTEVFSGQLNQTLNHLDRNVRSSTENVAVNVNQHLQSHARHIGTIKEALQRNLDHIDQSVRQLESKREGAYQSLTQYLGNLERAQGELRTAAANLTNAMQAGPIRGRWGEIQLRKIVELSGMIEHVSFAEQAGGDLGGRPDMIVLLPNQGQMPVDSKCPMNMYFEAVACDDDAEKRAECLTSYAKSVRQEIKKLSDRKYWQQFEMSPEFVIMFVPIESCLVAVYECDPGIIEYAAENKVILSTPLTLLAFLKAVAYGWQQFAISKNAKTILEQGKELFKRTITWLDHLRAMGQKVDGMIEAYNKTVASLQTRFLPAARRFQELAAIPENVDEVPTVNRGVSSVAPDESAAFGSDLAAELIKAGGPPTDSSPPDVAGSPR
jgi:DNA recombination protein RmuC